MAVLESRFGERRTGHVGAARLAVQAHWREGGSSRKIWLMSFARIATVTMKTNSPREVARFWRELLGYRIAPNHSNSVKLIGENEPAMLIQPSESPIEQGAIHLDLRPENQLACLKLGATHADIGQTGDEGWVVMADPGGNLFCVLQSQADYQASLSKDQGTPTPID